VVLGGGLFLATLTYPPRSAYTFLAPVAILLALGAQRLATAVDRVPVWFDGDREGSLVHVDVVLALLVPAGAAVGALSVDRLEARSAYDHQVLDAVTERADGVDRLGPVAVTNYADSLGANDTWSLLYKNGGLRGYSLNAWLALQDRPGLGDGLAVEKGAVRDMAPAGVELRVVETEQRTEWRLVHVEDAETVP